jgi:hypothetical protein
MVLVEAVADSGESGMGFSYAFASGRCCARTADWIRDAAPKGELRRRAAAGIGVAT